MDFLFAVLAALFAVFADIIFAFLLVWLSGAWGLKLREVPLPKRHVKNPRRFLFHLLWRAGLLTSMPLFVLTAAWQFPILIWIFGALLLLFSVALLLVWLTLGSKPIKEATRKVIFSLEHLWLWKIGDEQKELYATHIRWRFAWWGVRTRRSRRNFSFFKLLARMRPLWLMLSVFIIPLLLWLLWWFFIPDALNQAFFLSEKNIARVVMEILQHNTGVWTLIAVLLGAFPAWVIWAFRDRNNLMQIENQRKDINLKDFQKLSEWASGAHLPEKKRIETRSYLEANKGKSVTTESFERMEGILHSHPTRRDGAASLQIAAVYQLEAFLRGDYGEFFRRPAFQLLKSLWLSLMQPDVEAWREVEKAMDETLKIDAKEKREKIKEWEENSLNPWQNKLRETIGSPLGQALTTVLAAEAGKLFRDHAPDLPGACFAGLNHSLPSLKPLELDALNLRGIIFQGAYLRSANLQGAVLWQAKLQGADLSYANLQGAYLRSAKLQGAYLSYANLQGAYLRSAKLQGAYLRSANLQGAYLWNAKLQGADLRNIGIDEKTNFGGAKADGKTKIQAGKWENGEFTPDEEKSRALREQLVRQGLRFVEEEKK